VGLLDCGSVSTLREACSADIPHSLLLAWLGAIASPAWRALEDLAECSVEPSGLQNGYARATCPRPEGQRFKPLDRAPHDLDCDGSSPVADCVDSSLLDRASHNIDRNGLEPVAGFENFSLLDRASQHLGRADLTPMVDCIGFSLTQGREMTIRGFVCASDDAGQSLLIDLTRKHMRRPPLPMELPVRCAAVIGTASIAARELAALEPLDILLVDDAAFTQDALACRLTLNHRFAGRGELRSAQLHVIDWRLPGEPAMAHPEAQFDELQVALRFELAQWRAALGEVSTLAPGAIIELNHRIDEQAVTVWIEHRCIGKGQLVAIGDRLGVRLTSVFGADGATKPLTSETLT
jgi:type III secretion system YscQ/HrcQ family protein